MLDGNSLTCQVSDESQHTTGIHIPNSHQRFIVNRSAVGKKVKCFNIKSGFHLFSESGCQ